MTEADIKKMVNEEVERIRKAPLSVVSEETNSVFLPKDKDVESKKNDIQRVHPDDVINSAFNSAIVSSIGQNDELKENILNSAEKVVKNKVDKIDSEAEQESKKAYFNNKKDACVCFGYTEETTEKWAVNIMNAWHNVMTVIWILLGAFTFSPITFVAKKIKVIFKQTWLAVLLAVLIYLAVVLVPVLITYLS